MEPLFNGIEGISIALFGAALAAGLAGCGSAIGVQKAGKAVSGVLSEKPELFGKLLVLQALPATQGIYGFIVAILILVQTGALSGGVPLTINQGWWLFYSSLPIAIVGLISGWMQGSVAASAIHMVAKKPDQSGRGMTITAIVETYAILALLVSILMLFGVKIG